MKKLFNYICLLAFTTIIATGCQKEDDLVMPSFEQLEGETWTKTDLDIWIEKQLGIPYNIEAKYRWDKNEVKPDKSFIPPDTASVRQVFNVLINGMIDPYVENVGANFVKTYLPRQYVIVGSYEWNSNQTITLGTAEGGRKITLYGITNYVAANDQALTRQLLHTLHHEFAHILHQNIMYPKEFKTITGSNYSADWNNLTLAEAYQKGFISQYARSNPDDDFVEMVSLMLVNGKDWFEALLVSNSTNADSRVLLRKKEAIVRNYFRDVYKINFDDLQNAVQKGINERIF